MNSIALKSFPMVNPAGVIPWCQAGYQHGDKRGRTAAINVFAGAWPNTPVIRAIEILEGKHEVTYDKSGNAHVVFQDHKPANY